MKLAHIVVYSDSFITDFADLAEDYRTIVWQSSTAITD